MNGDDGKGLNDQGGCAVDWGWLVNERIASVANGLDALTITFASGMVFEVRAALWQGKPFLAFNPFRQSAAPPPTSPDQPPK